MICGNRSAQACPLDGFGNLTILLSFTQELIEQWQSRLPPFRDASRKMLVTPSAFEHSGAG